MMCDACDGVRGSTRLAVLFTSRYAVTTSSLRATLTCVYVCVCEYLFVWLYLCVHVIGCRVYEIISIISVAIIVDGGVE